MHADFFFITYTLEGLPIDETMENNDNLAS